MRVIVRKAWMMMCIFEHDSVGQKHWKINIGVDGY